MGRLINSLQLFWERNDTPPYPQTVNGNRARPLSGALAPTILGRLKVGYRSLRLKIDTIIRGEKT